MFKDLIINYLKDQAVAQVSKKIGIDPSILQGEWGKDAIWSLISGLFHNSQKEEQLKQLDHAIQEDHDGSLFDDITSLLTKGEEWHKIVHHILGDKQWVVAKLLAQKLGITIDQANMVLSFVAPMIMGALGKTKQETGADAYALKDMLQQEEEQLAKESNTPWIVLQLLDKDGDGDVDINDFLS